jgi:hypothetical protein
MIAFEAVAPESGELTFAVRGRPGTEKGSVGKTYRVIPLESWGQ